MMTTSTVTDKATGFSSDAAEQPNAEEQEQRLRHMKKFKQNWRINVLATPKYPRGKYTYPQDVFNSGVAQGALHCELPDRIEQMSRPTVRRLVVNKYEFKPLHSDYEKRMDKQIEMSWNTIYNDYKKARRDLKRKTSSTSKRSKRSRSKSKGRSTKDAKVGADGKKEKKGKEKGGKGDKKKGGKGKGKKGGKGETTVEEEEEKELEEWLKTRSQPKKVFKPEPIPRGPIADLVEMKEHTDTLAQPKKVVEPQTRELPLKIPESALTYEITEKIVELAKPSPWRLVKDEPYILGSVKPEALQAKATPRIEALAKPKVAQSETAADVKEDPFAISPNALKYVATARILELAKPVER